MKNREAHRFTIGETLGGRKEEGWAVALAGLIVLFLLVGVLVLGLDAVRPEREKSPQSGTFLFGLSFGA